MNSTSDIDTIVERYAVAASTHGRAIREGDHKAANAAYDAAMNAYDTLRKRGADAQRKLLSLLDHADPSVRVWAGTHALDFDPARGVSALERVAGGPPSPEQLSAQISLDRWRKGELRFP